MLCYWAIKTFGWCSIFKSNLEDNVFRCTSEVILFIAVYVSEYTLSRSISQIKGQTFECQNFRFTQSHIAIILLVVCLSLDVTCINSGFHVAGVSVLCEVMILSLIVIWRTVVFKFSWHCALFFNQELQ